MSTDVLYPNEVEIASGKSESWWESLREVFRERDEKEAELEYRHPWVPIITRWIIALLLAVLLIASFIYWVGATIERKAEVKTTEAKAVWDAEQEAKEQAEAERQAAIAASEAETIKAEVEYCSKALYGIRRFFEKYGYSELDGITYLRSAFNRADATGKSLHDVLSDGQYLAYDESNQVLKEYEQISKKAVQEWHEETVKPCDLDYQFAELTDRGVYLVTDPNADGYARRWRAS